MKRIINQNDVERVSAEVIISYLRRIGMNDMVPDCIDIDDFVAKYLKCNVVIEDIYQSSDCLGYLSYGINPLRVYRDDKVCEVIFQTLVFDSDRSLDEWYSPVAQGNSDEEPRACLGPLSRWIVENQCLYVSGPS